MERQRKLCQSQWSQNIGQGHWVNIPAKSGGQGDVSCKV